jgi:hypothetical protein
MEEVIAGKKVMRQSLLAPDMVTSVEPRSSQIVPLMISGAAVILALIALVVALLR